MKIRPSEICAPPLSSLSQNGMGHAAPEKGIEELPLPIREIRRSLILSEGDVRRVLSDIRPYPFRESPPRLNFDSNGIDLKA